MDDLVRNIEYVRKLVGIDHVGIGSDLRGMPSYTSGFGEGANFQAIAETLLAHGFSDDETGKVMGGNTGTWVRLPLAQNSTALFRIRLVRENAKNGLLSVVERYIIYSHESRT